MLPTSTEDDDSPWQCDSCLTQVSSREAGVVLTVAERRVEAALRMPDADLDALADKLEAEYLGPDHFLLFRVKEKRISRMRRKMKVKY